LFVGANILDVGLLECLVQHNELMPETPRRPAPGNPDAHYYFWMIDGQPGDTGRYGQNMLPVPYAGWSFFTFGQYHIGQQFNKTRQTYETQVLEDSEQQATPQQLADRHHLTVVHADDAALWRSVARRQSKQLLAIYIDNESSIRDVHASLRDSDPGTFGEFVCWYDHVAYSHAIDRLEQSGMLSIPAARFMGALWEGNPEPGFFGSSDDDTRE
jgi:hypothetical protein